MSVPAADYKYGCRLVLFTIFVRNFLLCIHYLPWFGILILLCLLFLVLTGK